jgi:hypothetical protein
MASVELFVSLQFLNPKTDGRTVWKGDKPVARPLATQDNTTQNKRTQTSMPRVGFEATITVFERAKTVHALDRAATVISQKVKVLSRVYLHVATINVDSPDLTRKFIGTIAEITHNRYNTQFRV